MAECFIHICETAKLHSLFKVCWIILFYLPNLAFCAGVQTWGPKAEMRKQCMTFRVSLFIKITCVLSVKHKENACACVHVCICVCSDGLILFGIYPDSRFIESTIFWVFISKQHFWRNTDKFFYYFLVCVTSTRKVMPWKLSSGLENERFFKYMLVVLLIHLLTYLYHITV